MTKNENANVELILLDLDETLVTTCSNRSLTEKGLIKYLKRAKEMGMLLYICSRNPPYIVEDVLEKFKLSKFFDGIHADFRPKKYQVKQIMTDLMSRNVNFKSIIFIDDFMDNCSNVKEIAIESDLPFFIINYTGKNPFDFETIFPVILSHEYNQLKELSIK